MYSGIGGMKNFQTKLDVIGNNIANVNTYGYKKGRVTFQDLISQQVSGPSSSTGNRGGVNAKQVGLGSTVASIDNIHTQGSTQTTSRPLDLALGGDGFFVVGSVNDITSVNSDSASGYGDNKITTTGINDAMNLSYTRAGNFYMDEQGYLVNTDGLYLIGETGTKIIPDPSDIDAADELQEELDEFYAAISTFNSALATATSPSDIDSGPLQNFMDAIGTSGASAGDDNFIGAIMTANTSGGFNAGLNSQVTQLENLLSELDSIQTGIGSGSYSSVEAVISELTPLIGIAVSNADTTAQTIDRAKSPKWTGGLSGSPGLIQIPKSAKSFSISPNGQVTFVNSSGQLKVAGQVRLAQFDNNSGLEKVGSNLFRESNNSGTLDKNANGIDLQELTKPGANGSADILSGTLEMSNVDLSEEFTEMIVSQRGFQSNAKIITTSDEILQELVNLKR